MDEIEPDLKKRKKTAFITAGLDKQTKSVQFHMFRQTKSTNYSHAMQRQDTEDVQKSTSK